jgi:ATP-dependent DNA helicase RecQ
VPSTARSEAVAGFAGEPVLLVDALVDSRWTLTVVGAALLEAGSGSVSPLVLATAVSD